MTQWVSRPDDVVAFVERGKQDRVEVDRPDAVVGFLETDVLRDKRVGDGEEALLKAKGPRSPAGEESLDGEGRDRPRRRSWWRG